MEPMSYEEPRDGFLREVKKLAHQNGALLIFDEVITGFPFGLGGAQKYFKVTPDLSAFGKSMANGMPISALVGRKKYMKKVSDIFYSFTFGGEALSLAAAIATIKEMEKKKTAVYVWKLGAYLQKETRRLIQKNHLQDVIELEGKPCWQVFVIAAAFNCTDLEIKSFIQQELLQRGVLWYGQHNLSFSHRKKDVDYLLGCYKAIFPKLNRLLKSGVLRRHLRGAPISNIFKIR